MTIRRLFPLLFVALAAAVLSPVGGSAQEGESDGLCWKCVQCAFDPGPQAEMCQGLSVNKNPVIGNTSCGHPSFCECRLQSVGFCDRPETAAGSEARQRLLEETLAAIGAGRSISADGPFFYVRRDMDLVVRSKCDLTEVARVAVAEVARGPAIVGG